MTELPEYGASAIWHSHSMSVSCLSCLAATSNYSRLAQQMLPVLDFGTGKNVLVINTGHGIQVTVVMQSAVSNCLSPPGLSLQALDLSHIAHVT